MLTSLRHFFEIVSLLNWITPSLAMIDDVSRGGNMITSRWSFFIDLDDAIKKGYSQSHIRDILRKEGFDSWGHMTTPIINNQGLTSEHLFVVHIDDAAEIEKILGNLGVPIKPRSRGAPVKNERCNITLGEFLSWLF